MYGQPTYSPYSYMPTNYGFTNNYPQRQFMQPQPQPQIIQQPQMQVQQQPQQQTAPIAQPTVPLGYETQTPVQAVRFATEDEAKAFIVYPNLTAVFIDEAKGKVYLKSANSAGVSSIRKYSEIKEEEQQQEKKIDNPDFSQKQQFPQRQEIDPSQFASKEQLKGLVTMEQHNKLLEQYNFLEQQMRIMQNQIKSGKTGVATTTSQPLSK